MTQLIKYHISKAAIKNLPNIWDLVIILIVFGALATIAWGTMQMTSPYQIGTTIEITLDPIILPKYAISTVLRMFIALLFSLIFTFAIAPLAAKNKHAERIILPFIDIMQSIPVLGMLSLTIIGFIHLFPRSLLGPECAAIFAIFTSQVWNMALSLYQSLKTVPSDLREVSRMYRLSAWQRFWRIEVPYGTPGLLWNTMMSMSAGWFFVVASEAITVVNQKITLPGIGSYIAKAILEKNVYAMIYAIIAMFVVILLYDQLLFRPLLYWAKKFQPEIEEENQSSNESWFYNLLARTNIIKRAETIIDYFLDFFINIFKKRSKPKQYITKVTQNYFIKTSLWLWYIVLTIFLLISGFILVTIIYPTISVQEIIHVFYLGFITAIKVIVLIILASLLWIPIGVWIGLHPKARSISQPLIQFVAAFPANFLYPIAVILILKYGLNVDIWTTPLMIFGTQWYILFNIIAGTSGISKEVKYAAKNFGIKGWLWWKKLVLPAIFPFYATGAMAAAGGCWNASIIAEHVPWGDHTLISLGLGSYITKYTYIGDFPRIALGLVVMCIYVILLNRLLWQKLYDLAEARFSME